jgi:hypothetical protein
MDIEKLQGNVAEQESGVWVKFSEGDWEFKIASAHSKHARNWLDHAMSRQRKLHRNVVNLPVDATNEVTRDWLVKCIVKGWKNITSKGEPLEFNEENLRALLEMDSIGARVSDFIANACRDMETFGVDIEPTSEGSPATAALKSGPAVAP